VTAHLPVSDRTRRSRTALSMTSSPLSLEPLPADLWLPAPTSAPVPPVSRAGRPPRISASVLELRARFPDLEPAGGPVSTRAANRALCQQIRVCFDRVWRARLGVSDSTVLVVPARDGVSAGKLAAAGDAEALVEFLSRSVPVTQQHMGAISSSRPSTARRRPRRTGERYVP
jgi:hypothetical protein